MEAANVATFCRDLLVRGACRFLRVDSLRTWCVAGYFRQTSDNPDIRHEYLRPFHSLLYESTSATLWLYYNIFYIKSKTSLGLVRLKCGTITTTQEAE